MISYFFPIFKDNFGISSCFVIFLGVSIVGFVFVILVVKETKGKTLLEIWEELGVKPKTGKVE